MLQHNNSFASGSQSHALQNAKNQYHDEGDNVTSRSLNFAQKAITELSIILYCNIYRKEIPAFATVLPL